MPTPPENPPAPQEDPAPPACVVTCPICHGKGVERKQKWHCANCGQLLQTCCD